MSKLLHQKCYQEISKQLHQSAENDYKKAISTLNLLQNNTQDLKNSQTPKFLDSKLDKLRSYLSLCDLEVQKLEEKLSVIHVTGTKGKGSTCAYCESILQNYGFKTGFFSSPHLISVRERIRVNGQSVSKNQFAKCFWDVYQKLESVQEEKYSPNEMPTYFMFLTIMALKIFLEEQVDVAILEVGIGGEYDYTNILSNTAVVGISAIGLDHVQILGNTVELIAFQKSGIMKPNCTAIVSSDQPKAVLNVLEKRAVEKRCDLFVAPTFNMYSFPGADIRLGIKGPAQEYNASLAVELVSAWMNRHELQKIAEGLANCRWPGRTQLLNYSHNLAYYLDGAHTLEKYTGSTFQLSKEIAEGLDNCRWPGRTQLLNHSLNLAYYLDGAHTLESMQNCVVWFRDTAPVSSVCDIKVLVFNLTHSRNPRNMMEILVPLKFDYVIFCPNRVSSLKVDLSQDNTNLRVTEDQEYERTMIYRTEWIRLHEQLDEHHIHLFPDVSSVHQFLKQLSSNKKLHVLITGSLHLVGNFLTVLDPDLKFSS